MDGVGVRHFMRRVFAERTVNWIPRERPEFEHTPQNVDVAIATGALEWQGARFRTLLALADRLTCPWFFVGVDDRHPDTRLARVESHILSRAALVVARSRPAQSVLAHAGIGSLLPCPSLFAATRENPSRALRCLALISGSAQTLSRELCARIGELRTRYDVRILCAEPSDFFAFAERWPSLAFFCPTAEVQLHHLSACDVAVTSD